MGSTTAKPAAGPQAIAAVRQAARIADVQQVNQIRLDRKLDIHLQIWISLLSISEMRLADGLMPHIDKRELAAEAAVDLTGRRWNQFQRWFEASMREPLESASLESGIPAVYGVRISDHWGSGSSHGCATYFVSFDPIAIEGAGLLHRETQVNMPVDAGANGTTKTAARVQELEQINARLRHVVSELVLKVDELQHPS